jgi:hypothetical protein
VLSHAARCGAPYNSTLGTMRPCAYPMSQTSNAQPGIRDFLLSEVLHFVERARGCSGVRRIALVGSLASDKEDPKDADVMVTVEDDADLTALATAGRRLRGRAQSRNKGADIFLADPSDNYIGRTCHWRECYPGLRASCDARHCGRRAFLHDDLDAVTLDAALVKAPPLELWPTVVRRAQLPSDVETQLVQPLQRHHPSH